MLRLTRRSQSLQLTQLREPESRSATALAGMVASCHGTATHAAAFATRTIAAKGRTATAAKLLALRTATGMVRCLALRTTPAATALGIGTRLTRSRSTAVKATETGHATLAEALARTIAAKTAPATTTTAFTAAKTGAALALGRMARRGALLGLMLLLAGCAEDRIPDPYDHDPPTPPPTRATGCSLPLTR